MVISRTRIVDVNMKPVSPLFGVAAAHAGSLARASAAAPARAGTKRPKVLRCISFFSLILTCYDDPRPTPRSGF